MTSLDQETTTPGLRLELFVRDLAAAMAFYRDVLGFAVARSTPDAYAAMVREGAVIGLNLLGNLPDDHPIKPAPGELCGRGMEIVVVARDVAAAHAAARASGWAIAAPLTAQPWGLTDFRVIDPDGYYVRVTGTSP